MEEMQPQTSEQIETCLRMCRLFLRSQVKGETERERLLLAYQVNADVQQGCFPVNKELALEVAALMAKVRVQSSLSVCCMLAHIMIPPILPDSWRTKRETH